MTKKKTSTKPKAAVKQEAGGSCPAASCSAFARATITAIRKEAFANHDAISVSHIHPRAYCVAKPAPCCAVFAVPSCDFEPQVRDKQSVIIRNGTASASVVGGWYSLAYVMSRCGSGEPRVIFSLNPELCKPEATHNP